MRTRNRKKADTSKLSSARQALATNVSFLIEIARQGGKTIDGESNKITNDLAAKTMYNIERKPEVSSRLISIEIVADAFQLEPWRLLVPGLTQQTLLDRGLTSILEAYIKTPQEERKDLVEMAAKFVRQAQLTDSTKTVPDRPAKGSDSPKIAKLRERLLRSWEKLDDDAKGNVVWMTENVQSSQPSSSE